MIIQYMKYGLTFIALCLPLSMVCAASLELLDGETIGQWVWFGRVLPFAVGCIITVFLIQLCEKESWKKALKFPDFFVYLSWGLLFLGIVEAIWGMRQLYGFTVSGHSRYVMTGSFFNPGPYAGYLAMILPICLHHYMRVLNEWKGESKALKIEKMVAAMAGILILCVLPATMSRSAWIAALISCTWVAYMNRSECKRRILWQKYKKQYFCCGLLSLFIILAVVVGLFLLKPDSALGRLFMWKIALNAIISHPCGYLQGFAYAFGQAQENYFSQGGYTVWEERVAGSPEYAFNEYLELAITKGVFILVIILVFIIVNWWLGCKQRRYGICGAIFSLLVFSFSSYLCIFQLLLITLICLVLACGLADFIGKPLLLLIYLFIVGMGLGKEWQQKENTCRSWANAKILYRTGAYKAAIKAYECLYPKMQKEGEFLFEYGHSLHKVGRYYESNKILNKARLYTTDPVALNIIGKNYKELHQYETAEFFFWKSVNRLPGRIYPYYLLAKLYADSIFCNLEKFEEMKRIVLTKEPKVHSTAIEEMRREMVEIGREWDNGGESTRNTNGSQ